MEGVERKNLSTKSVLFCGGMAGVANWIVSVPPDTIKSRFQSAPPGRYPGGAMQVVMLACVFVSVLTRESQVVSRAWLLFVGFGAGDLIVGVRYILGALTCPLHTASHVHGEHKADRLATIICCEQILKEIVAKDGILGTYRGIGPAMIRAFPANAACFYGYETCMRFLNLLDW